MEVKDKIIVCPRCEGDACYENSHTFSTGLEIKSYMCFGCGFSTNSTLMYNSAEYAKVIATLPELYKDIQFIDEKTNLAWFPTVIQEPELGSVFINGTSKDNWEWAAIKATPIPKSEQHKFPIPGLAGRFQEYKSDMTTLRMFGRGGFMDALELIGFFEGKKIVKE
jgi:hypothetical protein